jgi:hypothetical protein
MMRIMQAQRIARLQLWQVKNNDATKKLSALAISLDKKKQFLEKREKRK